MATSNSRTTNTAPPRGTIFVDPNLAPKPRRNLGPPPPPHDALTAALIILHGIRPTILTAMGYTKPQPNPGRNTPSKPGGPMPEPPPPTPTTTTPDEFLSSIRGNPHKRREIAKKFGLSYGTCPHGTSAIDPLDTLLTLLSPHYSSHTQPQHVSPADAAVEGCYSLVDGVRAIDWMTTAAAGRVVRTLGWPEGAAGEHEVGVFAFVGLNVLGAPVGVHGVV
ncbi:hypothetical protein DFH27DRAFT_656810 [Peziza echinospora]|nr:hypothetical protein DFH27DRAFT_656810 [Peziza echinospora]